MFKSIIYLTHTDLYLEGEKEEEKEYSDDDEEKKKKKGATETIV